MAASGFEGKDRSAESSNFVMPAGHRLFLVFDTSEAAELAIATVRGEGLIDDDAPWFLAGEDGICQLDVHGTAHGLHGRVARAIQLVMSNDVVYLTMLVGELRAGHTAVVVLMPDTGAADRAAQRLRELSGHTMAIRAHLDFIPVGGGYTW